MKILVFPEGVENPYQNLLYSAMRKEGDIIHYLSPPTWNNLFKAPTFLQIIFWRFRGYKVFHLHWASGFTLRWRILAYWNYLFCLMLIKLLGYKLVWTAHNVLPHEQIFPNDIIARRRLVAAADLVIAHSASAIDELEKIGAKPKQSIVIPHGNYINVYPNTISHKAARQKLWLKQDSFVYLYFGQVREYKGLDALSSAYEKIKTEKNALIIAGKGSASGYIADDELQWYFNAADVVVFPFKKITTSGSSLLALSFGKAIIVPAIGDLSYLPDEITYKYSPEDKNGLINAMKKAADDIVILRKKSDFALQYAKRLDWSIIAKKTHAAIQAIT
jgi:glycosyltransferase involved in cell wall biosynthesis